MLPVLFSVGSITIYSFGFCLAIGFFLAAFVVWRRLRELGLNEEKIIDFILLASLLAFFFAKVILILGSSGFSNLVFWAVLLAIELSLLWLTRREKGNFWQMADEITFGLLPFLVLFNAGTFLDGSAVGKPTNLPWGMYFPGSFLRRQPVSLFSAVGFLLIWFVLLQIERQWRVWPWYKSKKAGLVHLSFLGLSGLVSFLVAFWRHSEVYWSWLEISLSLVVTLLAVGLLFFRSGRLQEGFNFSRLGRRRENDQETSRKEIETKK